MSRDAFERNLAAKIMSRAFNDDLQPILSPGIRYNAATAARVVREKLLALL